MLVFLVFIQVIYVCMVYGPIAAYLVEAFSGEIRYNIAFASLSHREMAFWRPSAAHRIMELRATVNILAGLYYL